jgi:hypothetical protein
MPARYPRSKRIDKFVSINILSVEILNGKADIVIGQVLREENLGTLWKAHGAIAV